MSSTSCVASGVNLNAAIRPATTLTCSVYTVRIAGLGVAMHGSWMRLAALIGLLALTRGWVHAQNIPGSIVGQVADSSGSAIPGAEITVRSMETGAVASTTTDAYGSYSIPNLLASTYEVTG